MRIVLPLISFVEEFTIFLHMTKKNNDNYFFSCQTKRAYRIFTSYFYALFINFQVNIAQAIVGMN